MTDRVPVPLANTLGDLGDLTDDQFKAAIRRGESFEQRGEYIMKNVLMRDVHYGNPIGEDRQPKYTHPILLQSGAVKLQQMFRLSFGIVPPDEKHEIELPTRDFTGRLIDPGSVSVTVYRSCRMLGGSGLEIEHASNCNSREPRFEGADGGWRYQDAREVLNECIAIARKRCKVHLTCEVLGLFPWLHTEEQMETALKLRAEAAATAKSESAAA